MKTLLLIISILISGASFSQDVRSFYQTPSNMNYSTTMVNINSEPYFVSIKDNSGSMLKIAMGELDADLNTSNYRYLEIPFLSNTIHLMSGAGVAGNLMTVCILRKSGNLQKIDYHVIDLTSFTLASTTTLAEDFKFGYFPSKQVNSSLITYVPNSNSEVIRFEKDLTQTTDPLEEMIGTLTFAVGSGINNVKVGELKLLGNNEYFAIRGQLSMAIFMRNNGVVSSNSFAMPSYCYNAGIVDLPNGDLFLTNARHYILLNSSLDSLGSGNLNQTSDPSELSQWGMERVGNEIVEILSNTGILHYDLSMNLISIKNEERQLKYNGSFKINNDTYFYGETVNPAFFSTEADVGLFSIGNLPSTLFIVKNFGNDFFTEFDGKIKQNEVSVFTGHCNIRTYSEGFFNNAIHLQNSFRKEGDEIGMVYLRRNFTLGTNAVGEFKGVTSLYNSNCLTGPINNGTVEFNEQMDKYNRGFYVTRQMIEDHLSILYWGNPNYVPAYGIKNWPAHGNLANGEAADLAQFVDVNSNGIYEPMLGDYPKIYGDQCVLNIYHQDPLGSANNSLEFHEYYFSFDCDTNLALRNSVFSNLRIINRGGNLTNLNRGTYLDFDLGNANDDFVEQMLI